MTRKKAVVGAVFFLTIGAVLVGTLTFSFHEYERPAFMRWPCAWRNGDKLVPASEAACRRMGLPCICAV